MTIEIQKSTNLKAKPDAANLTFGKVFTDHMLVMEHDEDGWHDAKIVPYGPLQWNLRPWSSITDRPCLKA